MKKILFLSMIALLSVFSYTCKNPADDITVTINADIFKLKTSIRVLNAKDGVALPTGLSVTIEGQDAAAIYTLAGTKTFAITDGVINLGIDPHLQPTDAKPLKFNVKISGASIMDVNIPFTVTSNQGLEERPVYVLDLSNPPAGVSVETPTVALTGNAIATTTSISTRPENGTGLTTTLTFPAGTQFRNAAGAVLTGTTLQATLVYIDVRSAVGLRVFPGGSLSSEVIRNSSGNIVTGTFNPATVTDITLTVDGQEVASFSQPVTVTQDIDPTYVSSQTGQAVTPGDVISLYSYKVETGIFTYESIANVIQHNANLALQYTISHLTTYIGSELEGACASTSLSLTGSWMQEGVTYPLRITIKNASGNTAYETVANITTTGNVVNLPAIPASNVTVVVAHASTGQQIANTPITISCGGGSINVPLSPLTEQPVVSLQLYVRCPGQAVKVDVLPTFVLYYRLVGSADFQLLGVVNNGFISTTVLDVTKRYDFRGVWNDKVKTVNNKQVAAVNTATVGDGEQANEIIGEHAPQNNLQMLTQACQ